MALGIDLRTRVVRAYQSREKHHNGRSLALYRSAPPRSLSRKLNRERFSVFLQQILLPSVPRGQVLVLDNLSAHKGSTIEQIVSSFGGSLLYWAPYCPQDNPIELGWSFLKSKIRKDLPISVEERIHSIHQAVPLLTPDCASSFLRHCGYGERFSPAVPAL